MSRIVVGPFNRVEGDLELTLDIEAGRVAEARVAAPLYRGFEQILVGRPAADALTIAPRICGICSVSQSMAAAALLRALTGATPPPNGELAANIAHAAENIADHLTHFYLFFMPDFARSCYARESWFAAVEARFKALSGAASRDVLPARARLLHVMGLIAGKWPHSLAFQPGGVTRAVDLGAKMRLLAILGDFRAFLEKTLFAAPLEKVLEISTPGDLADFAQGPGDFSGFLRLGQDLRLDRLGRVALPLLSFGAYRALGGHLFAPGVFDPSKHKRRPLRESGIAEDVACSFFAESALDPALAVTAPDAERKGAYSWAKAPRLGGAPAETGAVARQAVDGDSLVRALIAEQGGTNVYSRVAARVMEIARLTVAAEAWARALRLDEAFCETFPPPVSGQEVGMVEAARGALGHWASVEKGVIQRYQIVAPTTWNFSPREGAGVPGPLEQALVGVETGEAGAKAPAIQHVVRSFDPCMVCTAH
jgi:hydrogenase large subunit